MKRLFRGTSAIPLSHLQFKRGYTFTTYNWRFDTVGKSIQVHTLCNVMLFDCGRPYRTVTCLL